MELINFLQTLMPFLFLFFLVILLVKLTNKPFLPLLFWLLYGLPLLKFLLAIKAGHFIKELTPIPFFIIKYIFDIVIYLWVLVVVSYFSEILLAIPLLFILDFSHQFHHFFIFLSFNLSLQIMFSHLFIVSDWQRFLLLLSFFMSNVFLPLDLGVDFIKSIIIKVPEPFCLHPILSLLIFNWLEIVSCHSWLNFMDMIVLFFLLKLFRLHSITIYQLDSLWVLDQSLIFLLFIVSIFSLLLEHLVKLLPCVIFLVTCRGVWGFYGICFIISQEYEHIRPASWGDETTIFHPYSSVPVLILLSVIITSK